MHGILGLLADWSSELIGVPDRATQRLCNVIEHWLIGEPRECIRAVHDASTTDHVLKGRARTPLRFVS